MGKKRLVISIVSNLISVVVSLGVSFLLTPYLLGTLGKEAYSFYPLANNFVSYMTIITLALNSMASRFITIELVRNNTKKAHTYFSSVFYSNVILSALLLLPMVIIVAFIEHILNVPANLVGDVRVLFACVFASMIVNLLFSVFGIATFAKDHMHWRAARDIGQNLLRAALFILLFFFFSPTIIYLGIVAILVALFNGIVQYIFTRKLLPEYRIRLSEFDKTAVAQLVKSGIWNSINNLGSILMMSVSLLITNTMLGSAKSGDISIVQTLPNFMTTIISAIYGVLLPRISIAYAKGDMKNTTQTVIHFQKILGVIATVPIVLILLFGKVFFGLWVPGEDAQYLHILSIITILPLLVHSSMWTVYGLNVTNNKLRTPALLLIATGAVSVGLTVILIAATPLGIYAVPIASSVCSLLYYILFIPSYAAKKVGAASFTFYPHMIRTLIYTAVMIIIGWPAVSFLEPMLTKWSAFLICGIAAEVFGVILYIFIVFSTEDKKRMMNMLKAAVLKKREKQ